MQKSFFKLTLELGAPYDNGSEDVVVPYDDYQSDWKVAPYHSLNYKEEGEFRK